MHTSIKLIVGLGNPGSEYANTRHNAGAWFVNLLAEQLQAPLRLEPKLKSLMSRISVMDHECRLAVPTTYMNLSGQSVKAIAEIFPRDVDIFSHNDAENKQELTQELSQRDKDAEVKTDSKFEDKPKSDLDELQNWINRPGEWKKREQESEPADKKYSHQLSPLTLMPRTQELLEAAKSECDNLNKLNKLINMQLSQNKLSRSDFNRSCLVRCALRSLIRAFEALKQLSELEAVPIKVNELTNLRNIFRHLWDEFVNVSEVQLQDFLNQASRITNFLAARFIIPRLSEEKSEIGIFDLEKNELYVKYKGNLLPREDRQTTLQEAFKKVQTEIEFMVRFKAASNYENLEYSMINNALIASLSFLGDAAAELRRERLLRKFSSCMRADIYEAQMNELNKKNLLEYLSHTKHFRSILEKMKTRDMLILCIQICNEMAHEQKAKIDDAALLGAVVNQLIAKKEDIYEDFNRLIIETKTSSASVSNPNIGEGSKQEESDDEECNNRAAP